MLICTLYNHKGGVSKTTSTFNLGYALAESGYRVLLIDADPQCNLTELFMGPLLKRLDNDNTEEMIDLPGTSILQALRPRIEGSRSNVDVDSIELIDSPFNENIMLLKGDVGLSTAEDDLSQAHTFRTSSQIHFKFLYVALHDMIKRLGKKIKADFVFIDVGPSAGSLTRTCFLACDAFFVPVSPDRFNVQAISSLSQIIKKWIQEHRLIIDDFKAIGLPISEGRPLFLGTIVQNYKTARGSKARTGFEMWMRRLPGRIEKELLPVLKQFGDSEINLLQICEEFGSTEAVKIPDFSSLVTLMQECSKPIFSLSKEDTALISSNGYPYAGALWQDTEKRMQEWRKLFAELEKRVIRAKEIIEEKEKV
ncbi:cobyrinic acid ac-diamide synthase [Geobacillus kaustophilus GBlys]|uniref:Cobyrinic acid ac-diamide synthase n=1 Tax=Geobacillus kaustophilus GBlys TaxID=1337888 RepID=U2X933_GEOKU|nr:MULTISPECIES: ParA family protein [Geobacillus]EQB94186.1 hypothetical protein GA8_18395 [Geobacillus sp. A8]GAD15307.1 cobyrinic acid ac-diamide synthase [Geobacillus kaustophilus GBlys]